MTLFCHPLILYWTCSPERRQIIYSFTLSDIKILSLSSCFPELLFLSLFSCFPELFFKYFVYVFFLDTPVASGSSQARD